MNLSNALIFKYTYNRIKNKQKEFSQRAIIFTRVFPIFAGFS